MGQGAAGGPPALDVRPAAAHSRTQRDRRVVRRPRGQVAVASPTTGGRQAQNVRRARRQPLTGGGGREAYRLEGAG